MAIVKMNKFTLLTFEAEKEKLLEKIQGSLEVEFINLQDDNLIEKNEVLESLKKEELDSETSLIEENVSKTKNSIEFLRGYIPDEGGIKAMKKGKESFTLSELKETVESSNWKEICSEVKEFETTLSSLENEKNRLEGEIENLVPWKKFDAKLGEVNELKMTSMFLGSLSKQYKTKLIEEINSVSKETYIEVVSEDNQDIYIYAITVNEDKEIVEETLKTLGFSTFQSKHVEVPKLLIDEFKASIKEIDMKKAEVKKEILTFAEKKRTLELAYEYYENYLLRKQVNKNLLKTDKIVLFQGWIPEKENDLLKENISKVVGDTYYLTFEDVKEEEFDIVPVKLQNKGPAEVFDSITEMYSLPKYNEIDPTPLLTPFYILFFGMMVADFGYGIAMFAATAIVLKVFNLEEATRKFVKFFMYLSLSTAAFGLLFGTGFGIDLKTNLGIGLINPSKDTNILLLLAVGFGVVQIFFGLGIKAYMLIRDGKPLYAFFDVGSWVLLLVGLAMLVVPNLRIVGAVLAIVGSIIIVATQGRNEATTGAKVGQGLYALYGVTSYIGDLVSYTRLMALGIAGGSIAAALNLIIGMLPGWSIIIIGPLAFIAAHIFNMLLSLLGAYVHTARLQYVEYFSKFYDGGGRPFSPLRTINKYITLKKVK
ncbi:MAG: V-type ATP synthase subunit I [Sarcina sp.]